MKRIKGIPLRFTRNSLSVAIAIASGILDEEQRYFTDLTAAGGQYYELSDPITLSGDFEIEVKTYTEALSDQIILGQSGSTQNLFSQLSDGSLRIRVDGVIVTSTPSVVMTNKLNAYVFKRIGSLITVSQNGVEAISTNNTSDFVFDLIGMFQSGASYNGIISDLKIWTGGDRNTGTLIADFPLDEDWTNGNVAVNRAAVLGGELAINPTVGSQWTDNEDGSYTLDSDGSYNELSFATTSGQSLLINFDLRFGVSADQRTTLAGITPATTLSQDGTYSLIVESGSKVIFVRTNGQVNATLSNISIKQIPSSTPYATAENITDADAELFTQDSNGDWLGVERLAPVDFTTWNPNVALNSRTPLSFETTGTGGLYRTLGVTGLTLRLMVDLDSTATFFSIKDSSTGRGTDPDIATGQNVDGSFDYTATLDGLYFRCNEPASVVLNSQPSLKRLLQAA